jgi:hypothetical protein
MYALALAVNFCPLSVVKTSLDKQSLTVCLKFSFFHFKLMGFPLYSFLKHPQLYSMPSLANLQWHLGVWSIVTPMMRPIDCSNDPSSSKSWRFNNMSFKLVLGIKTPYASFFPSMVYYCRLPSSIKPLSHKTCNIPFGLPIHPSIIFFSSASIGKPQSLQSCCSFFTVPLVSMPLSASCFSNSFFVSFLFFIPSNKTSWCFASHSWAFR